MKKILLCIFTIIFVFASCVKQQVAPDQLYSFIKFYGDNKTTEGRDVKQLSDGGYIAIGNALNANNVQKMYAIKTDKYGNEVWHKLYPENNDTASFGNCVQVLTDGSFILLGSYKEYIDSLAKKISRIYIVKTTSQGDTLWTKKIGEKENVEGNYLQITSTGDFIVAGKLTANDGITHALALLTDSEGKKIWMNSDSYDQNNVASSVIEINDVFLLSGLTESNSIGSSDMAIHKVRKTDGAFSTLESSVSEGPDYAGEIKKLSDSLYLCVGTNTINSVNKIFLVKFKLAFNGSINKVWEKSLGNEVNNEGKSLEIVSKNEFVIAGTQNRSDGSKDIIVIRTDSTGKEIGTSTYGETGDQIVNRILKTSDEGFIITGANSYSNVSVLTLIKLKSNGGL